MSDAAYVRWMTTVVLFTAVTLAALGAATAVDRIFFAPTSPAAGWVALAILVAAWAAAVRPGRRIVAGVERAWAVVAADRELVADWACFLDGHELWVDEHGEIVPVPVSERSER